QILHFNYFIYNSIVIYSAPLFEYYARNDNEIKRDHTACSEQSEGIFFAPRDDTGIIAFVLVK
ncbi:hypothetical protein LCGC14_0656080, partial [marine sediment metagenome]